jgi:hypothetical protein
MFQLGLMEVIQADREREIESAIRRRQLLRPQDGPRETAQVRTPKGRTMAVRVRPTGG